MIAVYKIVSPNNRVYVGSSKNIEKRWSDYKKLQCKSQTRLYASFLKYGVENHKFSILVECEEKDLFEYEHLYSLHFKCLSKHGLNCEIPKFKEIKGEFSDETKNKMSLSKLGKKISEESIRKRTIKQLGLKRKESTKQKMRKPKSQEHKDNISIGKGKIVLNIETGIYYFGTRAASLSCHLKKDTLKSQLNGARSNRTKFIYA
jgi:group I intron endonuclease